MSELLLLSNSRAPGQAFLEHAAGAIRAVLGGRTRILFVPFASGDPGAYTELMRKALGSLGIGIALDSLHEASDPARAVREAEAFFVGGGNSFRLLRALCRLDVAGRHPRHGPPRRALPGRQRRLEHRLPVHPHHQRHADRAARASTRSAWSRSRSTRTTSIPTRESRTWARPGEERLRGVPRGERRAGARPARGRLARRQRRERDPGRGQHRPPVPPRRPAGQRARPAPTCRSCWGPRLNST